MDRIHVTASETFIDAHCLSDGMSAGRSSAKFVAVGVLTLSLILFGTQAAEAECSTPQGPAGQAAVSGPALDAQVYGDAMLAPVLARSFFKNPDFKGDVGDRSPNGIARTFIPGFVFSISGGDGKLDAR